MRTGWMMSTRSLLAAISMAAIVLLGVVAGAWAEPPASPPAPTAPPSAGEPPRSIPGARAASNVVVITIRGPIDEWTLHSVERRMEVAQKMGADAIVFEVDTPGGAIIPCLLISQKIKTSPIHNTVAWVNTKAYSGGAIVSLACREIVIADGAVLGDAIPIAIDPSGGLMTLGDDEREKMAAPVMGDLIDSARHNGYDENLVQGIVSRGVELWLVEHTETGARLFVNAAEYREAVGEEWGGGDDGTPDRMSPTIKSGTDAAAPHARKRPHDQEPGGGAPTQPEPTDFSPASPTFSPTLKGDVNQELSTKQSPVSRRPDFRRDPAQHGKYKPIEYVSDGRGILTFHDTELLRYRIAAQRVRSEEELTRFFGAKTVTRLDENWAEHAARFLSNFYVKAFLIVVFLVAMFVEMSHPGVSLPGGIAVLCLVGLVLPSILAGLAGWWTLVAIVAGVVLIGVELFLTPGVAIVGVLGVLSLFAGIVGTFLVGPAGFGPYPAARNGEIGWAIATTLISLVVAGALIGVIIRFLPSVPFLNRLVLKNAGPDDEAPGAYTQVVGPDTPVKAGMVGIAVTPLRPAGRVLIGERIVDAVADGSFIDAGAKVRVLNAGGFRTTVTAEHT